MKNNINKEIEKILHANHHDPFSILGKHPLEKDEKRATIRVYIPQAKKVWLTKNEMIFVALHDSGFFTLEIEKDDIASPYQITWEDAGGKKHVEYDTYSFLPQLQDMDLYLFNEGTHTQAYNFLGAHPKVIQGVAGVLFGVWAPEAARVSVVGDFNMWDGRRHPMRVRGSSGVWELFIPNLAAGSLYKFEIKHNSGMLQVKTDPYGKHFELRPETGAIVTGESSYMWKDDAWLEKRASYDWQIQPMTVYEVHLGSWRRSQEGGFLPYRELAHQLVPYVHDLGFTHIELLPITEHLLDESWGYQTTGYFAPTSRFGIPDDFRYFVDYCHQHDIGVILDWVPGHFPKDTTALARFDGSALYEHEDPRQGEHKDWGTLIFNYQRNEVNSFLLSSAYYWLEEFHLDGLRVDAVASMLYLDYSRNEGEWIPNEYGGRENIGAISFIRNLNILVHQAFPGAMTIAEESTAWPQVSRPTDMGGLGFSMKWNMGWMNDSLVYFSKEPIHRKYHHNSLTFGMLYAFNENFVLPFSHDEVVHGKGSLLQKMPGDEWQRFANLRVLFTYMFAFPGKKLLFMGSEIAQPYEWNANHVLEWHLAEEHYHAGIQLLINDIAKIYKKYPALYHYDFSSQGFEWIDCNDYESSILSFIRQSDKQKIVIVINFTPVTRYEYRIGVPLKGVYKEIFNSDSHFYGGENIGNAGMIVSQDQAYTGREHSIVITVPPLAGILLLLDETEAEQTS